MYGQDADLIMLGLASHEPHFALLREVVNFKSFNDSRSTRQTVLRQTKDAQFQLLHLSLLREYITVDFALEINNWVVDQERLIDDFIFLTFLVGNDFLPHLPTLDISEHAFDVLIDAYRELMRAEPGYIVHNGEIGDLDRLERLFNIIGVQEYDILQRREINEKKYQKRRHVVEDEDSDSENDVEESEEMLQEAYEEAVRQIAMGIKEDSSEWQIIGRPKRAKSDLDSEDDELVVNKDYRGRYYYDKFKVLVNAGNDTAQVFLADLRAHYIRGLMWCLAYYIKGCQMHLCIDCMYSYSFVVPFFVLMTFIRVHQLDMVLPLPLRAYAWRYGRLGKYCQHCSVRDWTALPSIPTTSGMSSSSIQ